MKQTAQTKKEQLIAEAGDERKHAQQIKDFVAQTNS
jgi:hypothetical protein